MSLKELTAEAHRKAETMPFVKLIFSGEISKEQYAKYLVNQEIAYAVLEAYANDLHLLDDLLDICRAAKIQQDILELEPDVPDLPNTQMSPASHAYLSHLGTIRNDPKKLMAHIYVRHMGDLYGGQMIAKKVPGSGQFYKFEDPTGLKAALREKLDDSMADEALICFQFATDLFEELMQ